MPKNGPNLLGSVVVGSTFMSQTTWIVSVGEEGAGETLKIGAQKLSPLLRSTRMDCVPERTGSVPDVTTRAVPVVVLAVFGPEYIHCFTKSWSRRLPVTSGSAG